MLPAGTFRWPLMALLGATLSVSSEPLHHVGFFVSRVVLAILRASWRPHWASLSIAHLGAAVPHCVVVRGHCVRTP